MLDFKAGKHFPGCRHQAPKGGSPGSDEPTEILVKETKLDHQGHQLKAYRDVIDGALSQSPAFEKERVGELGLCLVRTRAHVTWCGRVEDTSGSNAWCLEHRRLTLCDVPTRCSSLARRAASGPVSPA